MRKKTEGGQRAEEEDRAGSRCALRKRATGKRGGALVEEEGHAGGFASRKKATGGCVEGEGQRGDLGRHVPHAPSVASQEGKVSDFGPPLLFYLRV